MKRRALCALTRPSGDRLGDFENRFSRGEEGERGEGVDSSQSQSETADASTVWLQGPRARGRRGFCGSGQYLRWFVVTVVLGVWGAVDCDLHAHEVDDALVDVVQRRHLRATVSIRGSFLTRNYGAFQVSDSDVSPSSQTHSST